MSRVFAYCRVSLASMHTENQVQEIAQAGFQITKARTITETVSGSVAANERAGFRKLLDKLEDKDILVVTKLDRLGRNAMDVRATVEALAGMGVRVHCLALGGVDLTSPAGKMTMGVIAAVAEFERDLLIERTLSGQARARAAGTHMGRPAKTSEADRDAILSALAKGDTVTSMSEKYKISRATVINIRTAGTVT
ncbi:MAG: resolvase [Polaromonas sp.]|nr:resolvase [Polaromonas sp.]